MNLHAPLPISDELAPGYTRARGHANRDFAFNFRDAQGAPSRDGNRYHSAVDWFAPGSHVVESPIAGVVFDARKGTRWSGPVFGGVLGIERADGLCVVMRHVEPVVGVGAAVGSGQRVATVSPWSDGWPHAHVEVWRSRSGGYTHENMLDPQACGWVSGLTDAPPADEPPAPTAYAFEELPHDGEGGHGGPRILGQSHGYEDTAAGRARAGAVAAANRLLGRPCSTMRGRLGDGGFRIFALWWAPGTHAAGLAGVRFGPWTSEAGRDRTREAREANTGRTMRPFRGRASLYPYLS